MCHENCSFAPDVKWYTLTELQSENWKLAVLLGYFPLFYNLKVMRQMYKPLWTGRILEKHYVNECIAVSWLSQWEYFFVSLYFLWDQWERHLRMRSTTWIINTHSWAETDKDKTYFRRKNIAIERKRLSWNWKESNLLWEDVWRQSIWVREGWKHGVFSPPFWHS